MCALHKNLLMEHCVSYVRVQYQVLSPLTVQTMVSFLPFPLLVLLFRMETPLVPELLPADALQLCCFLTSPFWTACAFVRPHFKWHWHCCCQCQQTHVKFLVSIAESESISSGESCEMDEKSPHPHTAAVLICLPSVLSAEFSWILQILMGFPWEWRPMAT